MMAFEEEALEPQIVDVSFVGSVVTQQISDISLDRAILRLLLEGNELQILRTEPCGIPFHPRLVG